MVRSASHGSKNLIRILQGKQMDNIVYSLMTAIILIIHGGFLSMCILTKSWFLAILHICTMHILQGLNVVVFTVVKCCLGDKHMELE